MTHDTRELDIPPVCFLDDLARILRTSRRTIEKMRRSQTFPIQELPSLDRRPRWAGEAVRRFLSWQRPPLRRTG